MVLRVHNWDKFQHYKNKKPFWVKVYRDLLNNPQWHSLSGEESKALVMIWLVAAEDETKQGLLPDVTELSFKLRMTTEKLSTILQGLCGWIDGVSRQGIDDVKTSSSPEKRKRREERECPKSATWDAADVLCDLLAAEIKAEKPDTTHKRGQAWQGDMDKILRLDNRQQDRVRDVIKWATHDTFWRTNVLSASKLRQQFDKLELQMLDAEPEDDGKDPVQAEWERMVRNGGNAQ